MSNSDTSNKECSSDHHYYSGHDGHDARHHGGHDGQTSESVLHFPDSAAPTKVRMAVWPAGQTVKAGPTVLALVSVPLAAKAPSEEK